MSSHNKHRSKRAESYSKRNHELKEEVRKGGSKERQPGSSQAEINPNLIDFIKDNPIPELKEMIPEEEYTP